MLAAALEWLTKPPAHGVLKYVVVVSVETLQNVIIQVCSYLFSTSSLASCPRSLAEKEEISKSITASGRRLQLAIP